MMRRVALMLTGLLSLTALLTSPAMALPPFKKAFEARYADKEKMPEFAAVVRKEGCNVCHVKGEEKNVQNDYGKELNKLIEGDAKHRLDDAKANGTSEEAQAKRLEELEAAFTKVEGMKSAAGEKYGDLLKAGKLPAPAPAE